jgi:ABC-2 type transport system permease protein
MCPATPISTTSPASRPGPIVRRLQSVTEHLYPARCATTDRTLTGNSALLTAKPAHSGIDWAVGVGAATAATCPAAGCGRDPARIALSGVDLSQAVVAILAVLAISGEYSTGMIRTTLSAMPRRLRVLGAKAVVVAGLTLAPWQGLGVLALWAARR